MNIKGQGWRQEAGAGQLIPSLTPWGLGTWARNRASWVPGWRIHCSCSPISPMSLKVTILNQWVIILLHSVTWAEGPVGLKAQATAEGPTWSRTLETHF